MPINKIEMPKVGQYVYILKSKKTQLPIQGKVRMIHSLNRAKCLTSDGIVDVSRSDFALTREEAIQKVNAALDARIVAAQRRIEETHALKVSLTEIPELPSQCQKSSPHTHAAAITAQLRPSS